jgi:hypothetical protein
MLAKIMENKKNFSVVLTLINGISCLKYGNKNLFWNNWLKNNRNRDLRNFLGFMIT